MGRHWISRKVNWTKKRSLGFLIPSLPDFVMGFCLSHEAGVWLPHIYLVLIATDKVLSVYELLTWHTQEITVPEGSDECGLGR